MRFICMINVSLTEIWSKSLTSKVVDDINKIETCKIYIQHTEFVDEIMSKFDNFKDEMTHLFISKISEFRKKYVCRKSS